MDRIFVKCCLCMALAFIFVPASGQILKVNPAAVPSSVKSLFGKKKKPATSDSTATTNATSAAGTSAASANTGATPADNKPDPNSANFVPVEIPGGTPGQYYNLQSNVITFRDEQYLFVDSKAGMQLVAFDGTNFRLIPKPNPAGRFYAPAVILNNKLYLHYGEGRVGYLAEYDGTSTRIVEDPPQKDFRLLLEVPPVAFNGKIYMQYKSSNSLLKKLGVFDGTKIELIDLPLGDAEQYVSTPCAYKNKLYFLSTFNASFWLVVTTDGKNFDHVDLSKLKLPNTGQWSWGPAFVYHNKLMMSVSYLSSGGYGVQWMQFDGTNFVRLPNPGNTGTLLPMYFVARDTVFFEYQNSNGPMLVKFDGKTMTPVHNFERGHLGYLMAINNNKMYFSYIYTGQNGSLDTTTMVCYEGSGLTAIPVPTGIAMPGAMMACNNLLYYNASGRLVEFDGQNFRQIFGKANVSYPLISDPMFAFKDKVYVNYNTVLSYYQSNPNSKPTTNSVPPAAK